MFSTAWKVEFNNKKKSGIRKENIKVNAKLELG